MSIFKPSEIVECIDHHDALGYENITIGKRYEVTSSESYPWYEPIFIDDQGMEWMINYSFKRCFKLAKKRGKFHK